MANNNRRHWINGIATGVGAILGCAIADAFFITTKIPVYIDGHWFFPSRIPIYIGAAIGAAAGGIIALAITKKVSHRPRETRTHTPQRP